MQTARLRFIAVSLRVEHETPLDARLARFQDSSAHGAGTHFQFEPAGVLSAQSTQTHREEAAEFARSKLRDEAINAYRKALELGPNDAATHYDLGFALRNKGAARQAVEEFETAVRQRGRTPQNCFTAHMKEMRHQSRRPLRSRTD